MIVESVNLLRFFQEIERNFVGSNETLSHENEALVLPSRKRKVISKNLDDCRAKPRKLSKKERKRLEKVVDQKSKKLKVRTI